MLSKRKAKNLLLFWSIVSTMVVLYGFLFPSREETFSKRKALFEAHIYNRRDTSITSAIVTREYFAGDALQSFYRRFRSNPYAFRWDTLSVSPKTKLSVYDFNEDSTIALIGYPNPLFNNELPASDLTNPRMRYGYVQVDDVHLIE